MKQEDSENKKMHINIITSIKELLKYLFWEQAVNSHHNTEGQKYCTNNKFSSFMDYLIGHTENLKQWSLLELN